MLGYELWAIARQLAGGWCMVGDGRWAADGGRWWVAGDGWWVEDALLFHLSIISVNEYLLTIVDHKILVNPMWVSGWVSVNEIEAMGVSLSVIDCDIDWV